MERRLDGGPATSRIKGLRLKVLLKSQFWPVRTGTQEHEPIMSQRQRSDQ